MHDTRLCQWQITITEQKVFEYKTCQDVKKQVYTIYYTASQKTRLQKLDSYLVMDSLGDSLSTQQRWFVQVI